MYETMKIIEKNYIHFMLMFFTPPCTAVL